MKKSFKQKNNILGWIVFVIAFITYLTTIEPNFSFWDCGEYISSASKLEVTHAPGAALFQIVGAVFSMFAFGNGHYYSLVINAMSALFSSLTILFLFWTITHLAKKLIVKKNEKMTIDQEVAVFFSGVIGALIFAFSDTFWFSAVEGEVYAMASMFIALIVWLVTKWESESEKKGNERWIILIFFLVGLSVGVHMMCLLVVPFICLVYYAKKYSFHWKTFIIANLITLLVLAFVFKGFFPMVMLLFGKFEIFFVNVLGLPFHSGTLFTFVLLFVVVYFLLSLVRKKQNHIFHTAILSVVYMGIGFSCWMMIPIRANANPPMNLNNPNNALGMLDYYNRVQYGDWPTLYGQNYTATLDWNGVQTNEDGSLKTKSSGDIYEKGKNKYEKVGENTDYQYNQNQVSFMPRMFSSDKDVMNNYIAMYGAPNFTFNDGNPDVADNPQAQKLYDQLRQKYEDGTITVDDYLFAKQYKLINVEKPSFAQNLNYFLTFQNQYYFVRYLLWNFVGKQNDLEGNGEITQGNWVSGLSFVDNTLYGNGKKISSEFKNESTVYFYFLPFILGLIGFFFQLNKDFGRFWAVLSIFVLTSVGIIFYTGVKPYEPRERDYAMVGSFYVFAIWAGLGVIGIFYFILFKTKSLMLSSAVGVVLLLIPMMMGFQNYNPHDRSGRYTAYDFSYSVLKSLPKEDILFVYGDNDTYPVWAIQETEGFRKDVKVLNYTLLATTWNIDQAKRRTYDEMPIPSVLKHEDYRDGVNEQIYILTTNDWKTIFENIKQSGVSEEFFAEFKKYLTQDTMTLSDAVNFLRTKSEAKDEILKMIFGEEKYQKFNFLPAGKFILPVNKENVVKAGILKKEDLPLVENEIIINYEDKNIMKNDLILMDILAHFDWKRAINFSSGGIYSPKNVFYLRDYLQFDGFSYRLVPIKTTESSAGDLGRVDGYDLYKIVKNFRWGNFKNLNVHFDETCTSNIRSYRSSASRAAIGLAEKSQYGKAKEILALVEKEIPFEKYQDVQSLSELVNAYIVSGEEKKGLELAEKLKKIVLDRYDYFQSFDQRRKNTLMKQITTQPMLYSLVVSAVSDGYKKIGNEQKAYDYLLKSINVIDKRFKVFIEDLRQMGKEKANNESDEIKLVTPFYQYLFEVMKPYDSSYVNDKMSEITKSIVEVTQ